MSKTMRKIAHIFVAFSEKLNFNKSKIYPSLFAIEDFYVILYANEDHQPVPEALLKYNC